MKKLTLLLTAVAVGVAAQASERVLYQQNFETATDVAETGWTYGGSSIGFASDTFGKFIELSLGQSNGRSGNVTWGTDIFFNESGESVLEDGVYNLKFDFSITKPSNNQYNSCITVFTNHAPVTNQPYRTPWSPAGAWSNYLFDMTQSNTTADADMSFAVDAPWSETTGDDGTITRAVDTTDGMVFATGTWYTVTLTVDVDNRTSEYSIENASGDNVASGTLNVPETDFNGDPVSMYAEGLFVMTARYQTTMDFDNIKISFESSADVANDPTVALSRIGKTAEDELDLNIRAYNITFLEGEVLHVVGTDGTEVEVEFSDCDGTYVYETTKSGVLKAWTTCGDATSAVIETTVECVPEALPAVIATISSVEAGYAKSYTLSVNNADVPLRPTIFIDYRFTPKGATAGEWTTGEASGVKVTVDQEGTLELRSASFGYESTTSSVENDLEFAVKRTYDFARMTEEEISAAGFPAFSVLNSGATSGFNNWTARKRLYYYDKATETTNESDETVYTAVYPFGFIAEDNTENVIKYSVIEDNPNGGSFEGISIYAGHHLGFLYRIGVYNDETSGGNNKNIVVNDLVATDFVVCNNINNYGGNSCHPIVNTADEYYAVLAGENFVYSVAEVGTLNEETQTYSITHPVYRIDTACTKVTVFEQKGTSGINDVINGAVENNDPYYYTIDGLRMLEPTHSGLYIHQGKKVYIQK